MQIYSTTSSRRWSIHPSSIAPFQCSVSHMYNTQARIITYIVGKLKRKFKGIHCEMNHVKVQSTLRAQVLKQWECMTWHTHPHIFLTYTHKQRHTPKRTQHTHANLHTNTHTHKYTTWSESCKSTSTRWHLRWSYDHVWHVTYTHTLFFRHTHTHTHTHTRTHTHTHTHTHAHTHTHTQTHRNSLWSESCQGTSASWHRRWSYDHVVGVCRPMWCVCVHVFVFLF